MIKSVLTVMALCCMAGLCSGSASAQARTEIFGGYSYVHISDLGATAHGNGGSGSIAIGLLPAVSAVADFGVYHGSANNSFGGNMQTYLFGPKVQVPVGPIHPFAQALFGGAHIGYSNCQGSGCGQNSFALAIGGGIDADVLPHIGIRLIQAEYLRTDFNDAINNRQNNVRISVGVTLHF